MFDSLFAVEEAEAAKPDDDGLITMTATITGLTFTSENGYAVLRVEGVNEKGYPAVVTAVGSMVSPRISDIVQLRGRWDVHSKHGKQFSFESFTPQMPTTAKQAEAYLASGRIRGIGAGMARAIVEMFGDRTIEVMENDPDQLLQVPLIGPKKLERIKASWKETHEQRAIAIALAAVGASTSLAMPVWQEFGDDAVSIIKRHPYELVKVRGISFTTADEIARAQGWDRLAPDRVCAGVAFVADEALSDGHCYLPYEELMSASVQTLKLAGKEAHALCVDAVANAVIEETLICAADRVYTARAYRAESKVARRIIDLMASAIPASDSVTEVTERVIASAGLTEEQSSAVVQAMTSAVSVVTGGPGVGKSHTVATIVAAAKALDRRVQMCAPTGKAAKRMQELCPGTQASTIHRMLFSAGAEDQEEGEVAAGVDMVIVDESSMLDIFVAAWLLGWVPDGAHIVFVGDIDQLPSVAAGNVLRDLIASQVIPVTRLTKVFRQDEDSGIVDVTHAINLGALCWGGPKCENEKCSSKDWKEWSAQQLDLEDEEDEDEDEEDDELHPPRLRGWSDVFFWSQEVDSVPDAVLSMVAEKIPAKFQISSGDIQVLAPQKRGSCGTKELNRLLQQRLNPGGDHVAEYVSGSGDSQVVYRVGDRVMVTKNNYKKDIFNGTPCVVEHVDPDGDHVVTVRTDEGRLVGYESSQVRQLMPAYAITIHKSQGSEYPAVVIPVTNQAYVMLARNLLYTAMTRARQLVVLIGDARAIRRCVDNNRTTQRYTHLAEKLLSGVGASQ